jgi:tRNA G10  N-methylase Trm11
MFVSIFYHIILSEAPSFNDKNVYNPFIGGGAIRVRATQKAGVIYGSDLSLRLLPVSARSPPRATSPPTEDNFLADSPKE